MSNARDDNPPVVLSYSTPPGTERFDWKKIWFSLTVLTVAALVGSFVGMCLMALSYEISPIYFTWDLDWSPTDLLGHCLAWGAIVGATAGGIWGLILGALVEAPSYRNAKLNDLVPTLVITMVLGVLAWTVGGIWGVSQSKHDPFAFFHEQYRPGMHHPHDLARYGWVYGSSRGVLIGCVLCAIAAPVIVCWRWKKRRLTPQGQAVSK